MSQQAVKCWLYHVTWFARLESIARRGLVPGAHRCIGGPAYDAHCAARVFLCAGDGAFFWHSRSEAFAEHGSDNVLEDGAVPVVLRVPRALVARQLENDPVGAKDSMAAAYYVTRVIEAEELQVFVGAAGGDDGWVELEEWNLLDPELAVAVETEEDDQSETGFVDLVSFRDWRDNPVFPSELMP